MSNEYTHTGAIGEGPHARSARLQIEELRQGLEKQGVKSLPMWAMDRIATLTESYEYYMSKGE